MGRDSVIQHCHSPTAPRRLMSPRLCLAAMAISLVAALPVSNKHNILFLMCDSMDGRVLDPTSAISSNLDLPYMWSLASQGVNFASHYSNNPQCAPSRSSMFAG